jgi:hypothetical protein
VGVTAMRSDTAEAERAEGGAAGSNAVVPGAEQRGRSTLPSRAARPKGGGSGMRLLRGHAMPRRGSPTASAILAIEHGAEQT